MFPAELMFICKW